MGLNTLVSGPRSRMQAPLSPGGTALSLHPPSIIFPFSPSPHNLPSLHHSKGQALLEEAGLGSSHPLPGIWGVGRGHGSEKPSSELKFGDCQCQERLNNPVTSMKVNSRSAAHGKYECSVRRGERAQSLPATMGSLLSRDRGGEAGGGPRTLPCLPGSRRPGTPTKY